LSKLKEQELVWEDHMAKVAKFVTLFEKKKSRICELELEMIMV
jgi:hypothetical protein